MARPGRRTVKHGSGSWVYGAVYGAIHWLGKTGKGAGLPLVGCLLFLGGGVIVDGRDFCFEYTERALNTSLSGGVNPQLVVGA